MRLQKCELPGFPGLRFFDVDQIIFCSGAEFINNDNIAAPPEIRPWAWRFLQDNAICVTGSGNMTATVSFRHNRLIRRISHLEYPQDQLECFSSPITIKMHSSISIKYILSPLF